MLTQRDCMELLAMYTKCSLFSESQELTVLSGKGLVTENPPPKSFTALNSIARQIDCVV